jgi:threonine aldolase
VVAHTQAGQEVVLDLDSHVYNYEGAGGTMVGHVQMHPVKTERGFLTPEQVRESLRPANIHIPPTGLVCIENTHNRHGGTCCTPEDIAAVAAVAHAAGVPVHVDGARLFNAAVALGRDAREFAGPADSVTFCLSKGLGAPVGSIVCGGAPFVERARRVRKMLGGGMRQAGILAAAGLVALERMVERLAEDHANARTLAEALATMPGLVVDLASVQTNIVIVRVDRGDRARSAAATAELVKECAARKV